MEEEEEKSFKALKYAEARFKMCDMFLGSRQRRAGPDHLSGLKISFILSEGWVCARG